MGLLEILKRRTPVWPWSPDHSPIFSEVAMLARPTLTRPVRGDASKPKTQTRPTEKRFLLRVDGQIKRSFSSKEDNGNRRGGDKKGLSGRGRYRCRYGRAHHRDHQSLAFIAVRRPRLRARPGTSTDVSPDASGEMHSDAVCTACLAPQWLHSYSRFVRLPPSESLVSTRTSHIC
jgi:hypothetical protein